MPIELPLDYSAIERILPHRSPFLLVDRITEFEPDQRIVGIKNVSSNEPYLSRPAGGRPTRRMAAGSADPGSCTPRRCGARHGLAHSGRNQGWGSAPRPAAAVTTTF